MKKLFIFLLASIVSITTIHAQLIPITKNQKLRKEYKQDRQTRIDEGWDLVPFPGEAPQNIRKISEVEPFATNWGHDLLLPEALRVRIVNECKNKVVVKIFDTSGKTAHSYLQQGQLPGVSFTGEPALDDGNGHGTHVAGIIVGDQGLGILDALVDNGTVTWKPVKVLSNSGSGSFSWISAAIVSEATDNKQKIDAGTFVVCTASLGGGTSKVTDVETALKNDVANGTVWTVAAGNSSGAPVNYPGNSEYVVGIGSLDNANPLKHSSFESAGPELWVGMPGSSIYSTYLNNGFATLSGTSMATPFQASACAIALSRWGRQLANKDKMKAYLSTVASDLETAGKDNYTGWGISYIKAILDTDPTGITPPPPPPIDTTPPAHAVRKLTFVFEGNFPMYWTNNIGYSSNGNKVGVQSLTGTKRKIKAASTDLLTITKIEVSVPSTANLASIEYAASKKNTNMYFSGRFISAPGVVDYNDIAVWTAYFYELILSTQVKPAQFVDVTRIEVKDKKGNTSVLNYSDLLHWKNTP